MLLGALWLLLFSYRQVEYDHALWFHFSPHGGAARGLRAMGSVVAVLAVAGVAQLLAPLRVVGEKPDKETLARAHELVVREGGSTAIWPSYRTSPCCSTPPATPS